MLAGKGRNASESRQGRSTGGIKVGGLEPLGRATNPDLKRGQGNVEDLLLTTLSGVKDSSHTERQRNVRSSPSSFSKATNVNVGHLPQIPLGPHVNLSAFGAGGVSGSQYQSIKQALDPIQMLVSVFGGPDLMCGIFPSTCLPGPSRHKRSPRKRNSSKNSKNGGFKKPSSSGRKVRVKNLPHVFSAGGKFLTGGLTGAQTILGMVNGQQDRRMLHRYGQMPYRSHPPPSQPSPEYDN